MMLLSQIYDSFVIQNYPINVSYALSVQYLLCYVNLQLKFTGETAVPSTAPRAKLKVSGGNTKFDSS